MTAELEQQIRRAAEVLKSYGATEVYVFGSAATGALREDSDVDIAVAGLPADVFFEAYGRAGSAFPGRRMDLVSLDVDSPFVRYLREEEGELERVA